MERAIEDTTVDTDEALAARVGNLATVVRQSDRTVALNPLAERVANPLEQTPEPVKLHADSIHAKTQAILAGMFRRDDTRKGNSPSSDELYLATVNKGLQREGAVYYGG